MGDYTNIDIRGEARGLAPSAKWKKDTKRQNWFPGETLITGIGQGYTLVTPIQMASMVTTIANRGARYQPALINKFETADGSFENNSPISLPKVTINNQKNWDIVIRGMRKTVRNWKGTARIIFDPNSTYDIAGKTGTAQVFGIKQDEKYERDKVKEKLRDHAWFVAFAPIKDPQIAVAVVVENGTGGHVIAKKIFDEYFGSTHG